MSEKATAGSSPPLRVDNRKDLLLLVLAAQDAEPVVGVTRLQKYLFLLQEQYHWAEKYGISAAYDFEAYDFGPFDAQLYDDLQLLENAGLIDREPAGPEPNAENEEAREWAYQWGTVDRELAPWEEENEIWRYSLTDAGREFVRRYEVDPADLEQLAELKQDWNNRPLQTLLRWLYRKYPTWAAETKLGHLRP